MTTAPRPSPDPDRARQPAPASPEKLLLVDDDPGILRLLKWSFPAYEVATASDRESALDLVRKLRPKVISLDLGLPPDPDGSTVGLQILKDVLAIAPGTKVIVVSGSENKADAIEAIARGAWDFYQKPIDAEALGFIVQRAFHVAELEHENRRLRTGGAHQVPGVITADPAMLAVCRNVERIAPTAVSVLLLGASGTGKELLARGLHALSNRKDGPFVAINCAAIPETLLESELFGYEKGAFTGATRQVKGKIELADGGTLFLDEIGDMPFGLQAKLLRFIEERQIERLGGRVPIDIDVRIVCATHQPLPRRVEEGAFRQDLLYRLAGMTIEIPPLASRGDDVLILAQRLIDGCAAENGRPAVRLGADARDALRAHAWPGNVRELANLLQRAVILADGQVLTAGDLQLTAGAGGRSGATGAVLCDAEVMPLKAARERAEKHAVDAAIQKSDGNLSHAAKLLGISRPTLYTLLRRYEAPPAEGGA
jgi:two-component system NtrC family response regulator